MKNFLGRRLLFLTAHPDDESYAVAGTIIKNNQQGGRNFLICVTSGEQGKANLKRKLSDAQLKKIRKTELAAVGRFLKIDKVKILNWPDTQLLKHQKELLRDLDKIITKIRFDYILSFGPDGLSGHQDHITIGAVAKKIARQHQVSLVTFQAPPSWYKYRKLMNRRRKFGVYTKMETTPQYNLRIKIDPRKKLRAIKLHRSQFSGKNPFVHMPAKVVKDLLNYEYFKI